MNFKSCIFIGALVFFGTNYVKAQTISKGTTAMGKNPYQSGFLFSRAPLSTVIQAFAKHYHLKVSNPAHIQGIIVTGQFPYAFGIERNLRMLTDIEAGAAFCRLKGNIILIKKGID